MRRRALLLACAALVVYGSLYPFAYRTPPSVAHAWDALLAQRSWWTGLADVLGNVLLFVPMGLLSAPQGGGRPGRAWRLAGSLLLVGTFAFAVQVAQVWFPPREAALADVLWNVAGTALGMAVALVLGRHAAGLPRPEAGALALPLLGLWIAAQWAPLVPSLDWQSLKDNLKPLLLHPSVRPATLVLGAAQALAAGCLYAAAFRRSRGHRAGFALLLAGVVLARPLFAGNVLSLGAVMGAGLGYAAWRLLDGDAARRLAVAVPGLVLGYVLHETAPYRLQPWPSPLHWVPFEALLEGSLLANLGALLAYLSLVANLLWCVRELGGRVLAASVAFAVLAAGLEWLQTWIPGRTGDLTSALLALGIGLAMRRPPTAVRPPRPVVPRPRAGAP